MNIIDNGGNNLIFVSDSQKGSIKINGKNNKIYFSKFSFEVDKLDILIEGDNCEINIGRLRRVGSLKIVVKNSGKITIGDKTTFESTYILSNGDNVEIGADCMISFNTNIRTTDAHGIYDIETGARINLDGSIYIGDHVWLGQGVFISKNTYINKNSVIGANTFVSNKIISEHVIAAGNPLSILKEGIIWDRRQCDNLYDENADFDPFLKDSYKW